MSLRKTLLGLALATSTLVPAAANAWTQAYVADWIEPAFYYGGPANGGSDSKGTDCPTGIQEMDWDKLLLTPYRSAQRVAEVHNPEYSRPGFLSHLGFRGPHKENLYESPTAIPDPGFVEVSGKLANGLDLDGNPKTGFTGLDGQPGVDNAFYKVAGCTNLLRGPLKEGFAEKVSNETMRNGATTILMIVSGDKDPMNDDNVKIGIFTSKDKMVKDANTGIIQDYSFKLDPTGPSSIFGGKITNGVLETTERPEIIVAYSWRKGKLHTKPVELFESKIRLEHQKDGSLKGVVGGYRDWFEHYLEISTGETTDAAITENLGHVSLPGYYYALRREADGLPDAQGHMTGISTWFAMDWTPAFIIDPRNGNQLKVAERIPATVNK